MTKTFLRHTFTENIFDIVTTYTKSLSLYILNSYSLLYRQYTYIVGKYKNVSTMYVYCVYPAMSKCSKQLPNCLKIAETSVVLIVLNGFFCEVRAFTVTLSYRR